MKLPIAVNPMSPSLLKPPITLQVSSVPQQECGSPSPREEVARPRPSAVAALGGLGQAAAMLALRRQGRVEEQDKQKKEQDAKKKEEDRAKEERLQEQQREDLAKRQEKRMEEIRRVEEKKKQGEAKRQEEAADQEAGQRQQELKKAEERRKEEERRKGEERRKQQEAELKKAQEAQMQAERRKEEEARKQEEDRQAEQKRKLEDDMKKKIATTKQEESKERLVVTEPLAPVAPMRRHSSFTQNPSGATPRTSTERRPSLSAALPKTEEAKRAVAELQDSQIVLATGAHFLKHGRMGKPHRRFIYISANGSIFVCKENTRVPQDDDHVLSLPAVVDILTGKKTKEFQRDTAKTAKEENCFSIVAKKKTLNLEAASERQRNEWVRALTEAQSLIRRLAQQKLR